MLYDYPVLDKVIVVKVGTTTMFRHEHGRELLNDEAFQRVGQQVIDLVDDKGSPVAVVSSGAVTAGMEVTHTLKRPTGEEAMPEIQRLATIGWHRVLNKWDEALDHLCIGGLLLTKRELSLEAPEHDEALRTTHTLM